MSRPLLLVVASLSLLVPITARAASPLRYATTWTDDGGATRDITFDGAVTRGSLTGTIRIDAVELDVIGVVAVDGSVSGSVRRPNGTQAATFSGRVAPDGILKGDVRYGGRTKEWNAPGVSLPAATAP